MNKSFKAILIFLISLIPSNIIKSFFINIIPGCSLKNVKLGYFNYFLSESIKISNSSIGNFNFFNISLIDLENDTRIGSRNIFTSKNNEDAHKLKMIKSQISFDNFFEFNGNIILGENVVFGGRNSKIIAKNKRETFFKKNIFIGSNCIIASGIKVSENVTIGAGSYINKDINKKGIYFTKKLQSKNL